MNIGEKLRFIREHEGFKLRELASRSGIHENSLSNYEKGRREPKYSYVEWILEAMGYELVIQRRKQK